MNWEFIIYVTALVAGTFYVGFQMGKEHMAKQIVMDLIESGLFGSPDSPDWKNINTVMKKAKYERFTDKDI